MGKETKAHASGDIWHLGIEDLLVSSVEPAQRPVPGSYVINLRTSSVPIEVVCKTLQRFEHLHVYQLERRDKDRPQYLLRLGILETDLEADAILKTIRGDYPSAFTTSARDDDRAAVARGTRGAAPARPAGEGSAAKRCDAGLTGTNNPAAAGAVAGKPPEALRWNIDEVLPELGAMRQPTSGRHSTKRAVPESRRAVTPAVRPAARAAKEPRILAQSALLQPPVAPPVTPPPASSQPAGSPESKAHTAGAGIAPVEGRTVPPDTTRADRNEPFSPPQQGRAAAGGGHSSLTTSQAHSVESAAAARPPDQELDCDPDAVTDQVEALVFTFEAPKFEAGAHAPSTVQGQASQAPAAGGAAPEAAFTIEPSAMEAEPIQEAAERTTIEVLALDPEINDPTPVEAEPIHAAAERTTIEVEALDPATIEPSAIEAGPIHEAAERTTIEVVALDPAAIEPTTVETELIYEAAERTTIEVVALDPATIGPSAVEAEPIHEAAEHTTIEVAALDPVHIQPTAMEATTVTVTAISDPETPEAPTIESQLISVSTGEARRAGALAEQRPCQPEREDGDSTAAREEQAGTGCGSPDSRGAKAEVLCESDGALNAGPCEARAQPAPAASELVLTGARAMEGTRTIGTPTTRLETENGQASQWFAVELMQSEDEIDPGDVPNLNIFCEYRLYTVTGLDQDRVVHALRLGFFSSPTAAAAVAGYLAAFFAAPCTKRVSIAEHERLEDRRVAARKDVGAMDEHAVIELAGPVPSPVPQARAELPVSGGHKVLESTSIWSRLIQSRRR